MTDFKKAIGEAFEVEVLRPPRLKQLPKPGFFFELDNWPKGYGPSDRNNSFYLNRDDSWYEKFEELAEYKKEKGDCNVPRGFPDNPSLGKWANTQRSQYKLLKDGMASPITAYRIRALEGIGFQWNSLDGLWYERLEELKEYKKEKGDCNVPQRYQDNRSLGKWVQTQQYQYRRWLNGEASALSENRIQRLEEIGFWWRIRGNPIPVRDNWRSRADSLARCKILSKL